MTNAISYQLQVKQLDLNIYVQTNRQMPTPYYNLLGSLGIAPTFLKLDSWSPGMGSIPIISTKVINQIKKGKL